MNVTSRGWLRGGGRRKRSGALFVCWARAFSGLGRRGARETLKKPHCRTPPRVCRSCAASRRPAPPRKTPYPSSFHRVCFPVSERGRRTRSFSLFLSRATKRDACSGSRERASLLLLLLAVVLLGLLVLLLVVVDLGALVRGAVVVVAVVIVVAVVVLVVLLLVVVGLVLVLVFLRVVLVGVVGVVRSRGSVGRDERDTGLIVIIVVALVAVLVLVVEARAVVVALRGLVVLRFFWGEGGAA